ncbi:hypothetical protein CY35_07G068900 [Sphagnum magellanicum]|uniref:Uncharacterized protein n=1 Tax=Sphagnum magellanicum TaxID=128215 RepID=A0ACB8HLL7_9BRYO|nr:hypothetical protein CY35_07G068900 [Sphagnum magellanicum]
MADRSHEVASLEGEIMSSSVAAAAASTPVLLEVGFGCCDGEKIVEAGTLSSEDWKGLVAEVENLRIGLIFRVNKELLVKQSTYFRSIFSNFREAGYERIMVKWDTPTIFMLLQCMHGFNLSLSSSMVAPLLQGAVFFGVESAISACEDWVASMFHTGSNQSNDNTLVCLPSIWTTASDTGVTSIMEHCAKGLAINFAEAVLWEGFVDIPFLLLWACVDHPELTVHSEMQLCNALLRWYENQTEELRLAELTKHLCEGYTSIFKKKSWVGKPAIRLTRHSQEVDLSGCQQVTGPLLFWSSAACNLLSKPSRKSNPLFPHKPLWPDIPCFENLKTFTLSRCWRIQEEDLCEWLAAACPKLLILRLQDCPQLAISIYTSLSACCPLLEVLDLSVTEEIVEMKGAVTVQKSQVLVVYPVTHGSYNKSDGLPNLKELSLRGRSELSDGMFNSLGYKCPALQAVDISGCSQLTDSGIATFLNLYPNCFKDFRAAGTSFGPASSRALLHAVPVDVASTSKNHALQTLDLDKCFGLEEKHLIQLLKYQPFLAYLSMAYTCVSDTALFAFSGTDLLHLNLRETQVSGRAVTHIMAKNSRLKVLNTRGCTQMATNNLELQCDGQSFQLEEVIMGWGLSDSSFKSMGLGSCRLQSLTVGVGGTVSNTTLRSLSHISSTFKHISLCFQVISDEGMMSMLQELKGLHTLELRHCLGQISRESIRMFKGGCGLNLTCLRLERVTPWMEDSDVLLLSSTCPGLCRLSFVGCHCLTSDSLRIIASKWHGLYELKLEDCYQITMDGASCLLLGCQALQVLHLRHTGKGLSGSFIQDSSMHLPLLQKLALDTCDSVEKLFNKPTNTRYSALRVVQIARCHQPSLFCLPSTRANHHYFGQCHKDTIVLEWNTCGLKRRFVNERLCFS